ncbi:MAG: type 2 isopentenyl-diphosphate Delta-isomerase [Lactobacillus sp.]|jgi:isopentenyl-diphosphate delta-isomerase|nr:type 2 isopentenyl-diphosphate Delta-isomerase [Lactobacillus sp.]MCI2033791.1 type 2 isopentenyl-diphosphate Delta-isomerase [Lactobacillus sp.]
MPESQQSHRKDEHVFLAEKYFRATADAGFEQVRLVHNPLPETAVSDVSVTPHLFDWQWPFLINAMTGGSQQTGVLNAQLGRIAHALHLPIASGSQSVALREPALAKTFTPLRSENPDGFVLANLGASATWQQAQAAVAMLDANALELHINAIQEAVMPEGDRDFHWLDAIADIVAHSHVPVIVKEVGNGMTHEALTQLTAIGVQYVDVGGRGGTNFAQIENARRSAPGPWTALADFGQSTVESLLEVQASPLTVIATGGVRSPLDIVKALRLGASAVGISGQVLHWVIQDGEAAAQAQLASWQATLPVLLAALGAADLAALRQLPVVLAPELRNYVAQRQLTLPSPD